jgi:uncharacterized protein YacL
MIHLIRAIFLLLVSAVASIYLLATINVTLQGRANVGAYIIMVGGVILTFVIITADIVVRRKNLATLSGLLLGLVVGMVVSLGIGYLIEQGSSILLNAATKEEYQSLIDGTKLLVALMICYVTVSFVLQTKDDFRFIIPYVEFQRATKGPRPIILDTSVIIDGRIADMAATGMFETTILVPRFVLNELQTIADSGDRLKRSRGRRGLDVLEKLKGLPRLELRFWDGTLVSGPADDGVDQKLVALAQQEGGRIVTNDFNLNKVASLRGVSVININAIADALKPVVLPGESMKVRVVKPGENAGQGVGYLEDGTMVVVEGARDKVGQEVEMVVTNMIQNPAGKMIFGRATASHAAPHPAPPAAPAPPAGPGGGPAKPADANRRAG